MLNVVFELFTLQ